MKTAVSSREGEFGRVLTRRGTLRNDSVVVVEGFVNGDLDLKIGGRVEGVGLLIERFRLI